MSENPFKLIRSTDQPPKELRAEVVSSVKFVMLMMRFVQLFVADFSLALFDKVRRSDNDAVPPPSSHKSSSPHGS